MQNIFPTKRKKAAKTYTPIRIRQTLLAEYPATTWSCNLFRYHGMQQQQDKAPGMMIQIKR